MKLRQMPPYLCVIVLGLCQSIASAAVHDRYVRMTLDPSQLTTGSGYVELSTGFSDTFKPAQLTGTDMLNVHAEFFDPQGNQLYIVLRDLGGGYLDPSGWQWFQASVGTDVGVVSGNFVNGWIFKDSLPQRIANYACCTVGAGSQSVITSAGFGFDLIDSSIAIGSMRFQFNFNQYTNPVFISDGGGFNRFSFKMRSEDIALVRKPFPEPIKGPWDDDGVAIDVDGNGIDLKAKKIAVGYGGAQHYLYIVNIFPGIPDKSDFAYPIFLPDGFMFDPIGEQNYDDCADGTCDGLSQYDPACLVTFSGTRGKKNQTTARNAIIEISGSFTGSRCGYKVHISTAMDGKGRNAGYYPMDCTTAQTSVGGDINALVKVTNGVQIYDNITGVLLSENLGQHLEPVGCP
jgi:hypothetical protein